MRIEITNVEFAHNVLANAYLLNNNPNEQEPWKIAESSEDLERLKRVGGMRYNSIELPEPLGEAGFLCHRVSDTYKALVYVSARDKNCFRDISLILKPKIKKIGNTFVPTTLHGTGYILNKQEENIISIKEEHEGEIRQIGIGCGGACERKFRDSVDFLGEIQELETALNLFVDSCLTSFIKSKKICAFPEINIYLNP